ncbi:MAG: phospholipase D-like domain-containing protein [Bacteroidales bacterium]|nr:phospholipase D-like domain-containing protein [Bacteroidales bacterium]
MKYIVIFSTIVWMSFLAGTASGQLFEDFEQGVKATYSAEVIDLGTGPWQFDDALIGTLATDKKNGQRAARIRNGFIQMEFDAPNGLGELSFYAANFSSDSNGAVQVSYSVDQGASWTDLGESFSLGSELMQYTLLASIDGAVRLRFSKTSGTRINIDDILISDYFEYSEHPAIFLRINDIPYESGSTFNFGTNVGTAGAVVQIRNTGEEDLVIDDHEISGDGFYLVGEPETTLGFLETASFELMFASETPGIKEGMLKLHTNDPNNSVFTLNLTAEMLDTSQPVPIADARNLPMGSLVTVSGWVTVADQFAGPVYFQDETAGIAWYSDDIMRQEYLVGAVIGDSIIVTGHIGHFNNLLQIIDEVTFEVFPEANSIQEPVNINTVELNSGEYEGMLVRINELEFTGSGIFSGGTNYTVVDAHGEAELRVDNFTNIPGTVIPNTIIAATGVAGRFINTHQLLPRFTQDLEVLTGPIIFTAPPYEVSATAHSIALSWETVHAGHSEVRYGLTGDLELGKVMDEEHKTLHSITLTGLDPATVYKVQLRSAFDADTSATNIYVTSTSSPPGSSGDIHVFFNKDVAHELATFQEASQNIDFAEKFIGYIDLASETAEFAFYNISGSVGEVIADAILDAHHRGVAIRIIASGHTGSVNTVIQELAASGVKAVQSLGNEQMHNKFAVFDAHHQDPAKARIITGSWNATDLGTHNQFQNMVVVQDVSLARAYLLEFNQMWGAESGSFNPGNARFSRNKTVTNPSVFWIGDDQTRIELYFSPQGGTESHINRHLSSAEKTIDLGLNLITRRTISNTMRSRFNQGVKVRGVLGDISGQASEWEYLSSWADVHHLPQGTFGLLHHKYAIIDGEQGGYNAKVITGSHNWSANANFQNDENTLVIHNSRVANEFFQEYGARYWQAGGEEEFEVSTHIEEIDVADPANMLRMHNYPNPFSLHTNIRFELPAADRLTLQVFDITGRLIATLIDDEPLPAGSYELGFDASQLARGFYIGRITLGSGQSISHKMMCIK